MQSFGLPNKRSARVNDYKKFLDMVLTELEGLTVITHDKRITDKLLGVQDLKVEEGAITGVPHE